MLVKGATSGGKILFLVVNGLTAAGITNIDLWWVDQKKHSPTDAFLFLAKYWHNFYKNILLDILFLWISILPGWFCDILALSTKTLIQNMYWYKYVLYISIHKIPSTSASY